MSLLKNIRFFIDYNKEQEFKKKTNRIFHNGAYVQNANSFEDFHFFFEMLRSASRPLRWRPRPGLSVQVDGSGSWPT